MNLQANEIQHRPQKRGCEMLPALDVLVSLPTEILVGLCVCSQL